MKIFGNLISKFLIFVFLASTLLSCKSDDSANNGFKEKYGQRVEEIQSARMPPAPTFKQVTVSTPPTEEEVAHSVANDYYPYVDIAKFGEKAPQNYLPGAEVYEQSRNNRSGALPANIFEITYNLVLHPPFQKIGAEFDVIKVPESDAYGVKTAMSDKTYLLAGGDSLQKSIDEINADKNLTDAEISEILIFEKKQIARKKKMAKMLDGQEQVELAMLEKGKKSKEKSAANSNQTQAQKNLANADDVSGFTIKTVK